MRVGESLPTILAAAPARTGGGDHRDRRRRARGRRRMSDPGLAGARTVLGWQRTAFGLLGGAALLLRFAARESVLALGAAVAAGGLIAAVVAWRYSSHGRPIDGGEHGSAVGAPPAVPRRGGGGDRVGRDGRRRSRLTAPPAVCPYRVRHRQREAAGRPAIGSGIGRCGARASSRRAMSMIARAAGSSGCSRTSGVPASACSRSAIVSGTLAEQRHVELLGQRCAAALAEDRVAASGVVDVAATCSRSRRRPRGRA